MVDGRSRQTRRSSPRRVLALRRLCRARAQPPVFEGRTVEPADDRLHFVSGGSLDKCEALGFLRFVIADHFHSVGHKIYGGQPLLNVVCSDPGGKVAKKNGKAHSVDSFTPLVGFAALQGEDSSLPPK